jgi:geranyl-CoA carboxylase alpha subunit
VLQESENTLVFVHNDLRQQCQFYLHGEQVFLRLACRYYLFHDLTHEAAVSEDSAGSGKLVASMDGSIVDVLVQEGDNVRKGQTLAILEAMKMEHPLKADRDGKVANISVKKGDQVRIRQLLVQVEPTETPVAEES